MRRFFLVLTASWLLVGCGAAEPASSTSSGADPVAVGADLYAANCAVCHGLELTGTEQGPSLLSEVYEPGHHGDGAFLVAVIAGVPSHHWDFGSMPPVEGLTEKDVSAIVAFVRDKQISEGFEPYP